MLYMHSCIELIKALERFASVNILIEKLLPSSLCVISTADKIISKTFL